ncbi:glycosyltransferase family 4 protein [Oenococcus oeni]|uniref:glycosyltransferase family 4 protein n=1 Tax=Oenococcus oeni TaxID=1247 RepID=UPI001646129D|nr:glycosyltransferase family 4 protein [Oenococcus oeni]
MKTIMYLHVGAEMYGSDKVLLQLVTGLNKNEFKPIVVLPEHGPLEQALLLNHIQTEVVSYPVLRREYFNPKGILNYVGGYLKSEKKLTILAKKYQVDLIHVNTLAVLEGITLKKHIKKPLIWHVHEILLSPKFMWKLTAYLSAKYADKIVVVSNATGSHLKKAGYAKKNQIVTIYNGIKLPSQSNHSDFRRDYGIPNDAFVFGHVGRINAWKGQEDFLKVSLELMSLYPKLHILFSGDAYKGEKWREEKLKNEISESGFRDRIHYLGFQKDINKVYRTMDVLVSTSNGRETFSLVVAEAMSWSKPVIAYDVAGPSELIEDNKTGYLVQANNFGELASKMKIFLNVNSIKDKFGHRAYKRVGKYFNQKQFLQNFTKEYNSL